MQVKEGGCHCGTVRFRLRHNFTEALDCNCSICRMTGYLHLIADKDDFEIVQGESSLTRYQFGTCKAQHLFCSKCGVKSFYVPRSHPNGYSVNARCVDDLDIRDLKVQSFDGKNWEANIQKIGESPASVAAKSLSPRASDQVTDVADDRSKKES